jgi:hypothetical protein
MYTIEPLFGIYPIQYIPLDLNLGPSQLSIHRWTLTWDQPNSMFIAGPQRPDKMPEVYIDRMLDKISKKILNNILKG